MGKDNSHPGGGRCWKCLARSYSLLEGGEVACSTAESCLVCCFCSFFTNPLRDVTFTSILMISCCESQISSVSVRSWRAFLLNFLEIIERVLQGQYWVVYCLYISFFEKLETFGESWRRASTLRSTCPPLTSLPSLFLSCPILQALHHLPGLKTWSDLHLPYLPDQIQDQLFVSQMELLLTLCVEMLLGLE